MDAPSGSHHVCWNNMKLKLGAPSTLQRKSVAHQGVCHNRLKAFSSPLLAPLLPRLPPRFGTVCLYLCCKLVRRSTFIRPPLLYSAPPPPPRSSLQGPSASGSQLIRPGLVTRSGLEWGSRSSPRREARTAMEIWDRRCQSVADSAGFSSSSVCCQAFVWGDRRCTYHVTPFLHVSRCGGGRGKEEEGLCHFRFAFVDSDFLELCTEHTQCTQCSFLKFLLKCVC